MKTSSKSRYVAIIVEVTIERARAYLSTYQRQKKTKNTQSIVYFPSIVNSPIDDVINSEGFDGRLGTSGQVWHAGCTASLWWCLGALTSGNSFTAFLFLFKVLKLDLIRNWEIGTFNNRGKSSLPETKNGELQGVTWGHRSWKKEKQHHETTTQKLYRSFLEKEIYKAGYRYKVITELQLHSH